MQKSVLAIALLLTSSVVAVPEIARAHGGGLDSLGCHNDRKRGGYHCHRGQLAGMSFSSKAAAQQELKNRQARKQASNQQQPSKAPTSTEDDEQRTVYTTASGKKYHGATCAYLSKSRNPMTLKDAKKQGYAPCSKCNGK